MAKPVKQSIPITFSGGLDLKTDPWQVVPANFLELNNMVFSEGGRMTKRNGFAGLGTTIASPNPALTYSNVGGSLTAARKIMSFKDELLVNDAFNLYSYDQANNTWIYKGRSTMVGLETQNIVAGNVAHVAADVSIDTTTGIKVFAYENGNNSVFYSIQDIETGQFLVNRALFGATHSRPRCVSIAGKSWITAVNTVDHKIYYQAIVGQTVTGSLTALITNLNVTQTYYDIDVDPLSGNIYIAYFNSVPGVTISALSTSLAVGNTIAKAAEDASHGVSFFGDGTNIWVVYNNGSDTKAFIVNNAVSATVLAPTVVAAAANANNVTGVYSSTQSKAFIFSDLVTKTGSITATAQINFNTLTVAGTAGTSASLMGSLNIVGKAFAISGIPHVVGLYSYASNEGVIQATNFLINLYNVTPTMGSGVVDDVIGNIAAKIAPDESALVAPTTGHLSGIHQSSSGIWEMALLKNVNYTFESQTGVIPGFSPTGVIDCQFDFNLTNPDSQDLGNNLNLASGELIMYDGAYVVEQNFHIYPNSGAATVGTSGTITVSADATYSYIYVYEWIDNQGQIHRSFPSPVVTPLAMGHDYTFASGTSNGSVSLTLPCLRVTNKPGTQVLISVYRTLANGSVYYRTLTALTSPQNQPGSNTITVVDVLSDALIEDNIQLYSNGALGYFAPPAPRALSNFKNRLLAVPFEGGTDFLYSNQVLPNFPVQFVPFFDQNIGSIGGPIVTLAGMDDKIIIFKSGDIVGPSILYMVGQGPAPSGASNDFTDPLPVAVDVGCVDRASVVLTPVGLMFKSNKGIYLLDRALNATYIGAPVDRLNQYNVVSAKLIPDTTEVRFLLSNGMIIVYDYYYKYWATFSNPAGISDCIFQGQHTYVASNGQVYQETPGVYVDGTNTPILMNFTTSWIKLAGLQGYQRSYFFYLLAEYLSPHSLELSIAYNFSDTPSQTSTIVPDASNNLENWRVFLSQQRCQSFQITLQEVAGATNGAALSISGLNLIVGAKSQFRTIPAAQTVGQD
jgi:hypothetical protein